jgi:DNA helicase-2/ATP-dependent DNA helicase PcrA
MSYHGKAYASREVSDASRAASGKKRSGWNPNWKKPNPVVRGSAYKPITNPSAQQSAIFAHIAASRTALVVQALAGTGKTATSVECMNKYVPVGKSILYVIFANRNAREAEGKCGERVEVRTCHAFALAALKKAYVSIEVDAHGEKSRNIAQALLGPEEEKLELRYNFCKALSLAKSYLCEDVESVIEACDKHEIETCEMSEVEFAEKVLEGLELSARQYTRVDFDDMIWLAIKKNIAIPKFDYVFADECQDLSPVRIELVLRSIAPGGKLIAIGDRNQAIFSFTGADEAAMDKLQERTSAENLPLYTTYRCGKKIVELAQAYVPEYVAAETNPDGLVCEISEEAMMKSPEDGGVSPGSFVISRTNAPLVSYCLQLIRQGRKACVLGKDLGKALTWMIKRSGAESVPGFLGWLEAWKATECERLGARNKPCDHIVDKFDTLVILCEGRNTLAEVKAHIEDMFSDEDEGAKVVLLTAHKAKGLERDRVFILSDTYKCKGPQEDNVMYVSLTRAKSELYLVKK